MLVTWPPKAGTEGAESSDDNSDTDEDEEGDGGGASSRRSSQRGRGRGRGARRRWSRGAADEEGTPADPERLYEPDKVHIVCLRGAVAMEEVKDKAASLIFASGARRLASARIVLAQRERGKLHPPAPLFTA